MLNKKHVGYLYCITSTLCFAFEIMQGKYQLKYTTARFPGLWHGEYYLFFWPHTSSLNKKNDAFMVVFYRCGMMFLIIPKRWSNKYTVYVCHRWQQLCSLCTSYNIALFHSSVIYQQTGRRVRWRVSLVQWNLLTLPQNLISPEFSVGLVLFSL